MADADFIGTSQVAVFNPADLASSVTFTTVDDLDPEPDEAFTVTLQSDVVLGADGIATITILTNDDAAGVVGFNVRKILTHFLASTAPTNLRFRRSVKQGSQKDK